MDLCIAPFHYVVEIMLTMIQVCGKPMYDDFRELCLGGAERLALELAGSRPFSIIRPEKTEVATIAVAAGAVATAPAGALVSNVVPLQTGYPGEAARTITNSGSGDARKNDPGQKPQITGGTSRSEIGTPHSNPKFLLSCIDEGRYTTRLSQDRVCNIKSDQELMKKLAKKIDSSRTKWTRWTHLRAVSNIQFVQFELHRRGLVDIRKIDDIPPESRKDEYIYEPRPAEMIPPVGANRLLHIYHHPEDAEDAVSCLKKFPKRLRETLSTRGGAEVVGWGIHFQEGLQWTRIWIAGFFGVLLSTVFGVSWATVTRDVQGGFAISGYMMTVLVFSVGALQAYAG